MLCLVTVVAMNPAMNPDQDSGDDGPYYANGAAVPSWMGYRPLPVPTYEDIMFNRVGLKYDYIISILFYNCDFFL